MRTAALSLLLVSVSFGQFIMTSFDAPCGSISGLGWFSEEVLVLDSLNNCIHFLDDWTGTESRVIPLPAHDFPPVGLAAMDSVIYFAESGTALVHAVDFLGNPIETIDFADSGLVSITGLGAHEMSSYGFLFLMDGSNRSVYLQHIPLGYDPIVKLYEIQDDIQVRDIGADCGDGLPVACSDPEEPVRLYHDPGSGYSQVNSEEVTDACGVACAQFSGHIFFNCGVSGRIYRYCTNMGGTGHEHSASADALFMGVQSNPVPVPGLLQVSMRSISPGVLTVYSLDGRIIAAIRYSAGSEDLELNLPEAGVYALVAGNGAETVSRLVAAVR